MAPAAAWLGTSPALFHGYAYPEPDGCRAAAVRPAGATYEPARREFVPPYDGVRAAASPDDGRLEFLQTTYEAAATLGGWDRAALERHGDPARSRPDCPATAPCAKGRAG